MASVCCEIDELLEGCVRHTLTASDQTVVARHLAACAGCRQALALERQLVLLATAAVPAPDPMAWNEAARHYAAESWRRRLARAGRRERSAAAGFLFRTCCDPWLQIEHQLRQSLVPAWQTVLAPIIAVTGCVAGVAACACRSITTPLRHACHLDRTPAALSAR